MMQYAGCKTAHENPNTQARSFLSNTGKKIDQVMFYVS